MEAFTDISTQDALHAIALDLFNKHSTPGRDLSWFRMSINNSGRLDKTKSTRKQSKILMSRALREDVVEL